jgi:cobyrinic acid a,c-diamide synthase
MNALVKHAFLVAAPHSNSGKTLITLGLIKAFCNNGLVVQPYKCGPDYIDPMHHKAVSGRPSYNLDTWMDDAANVKTLFEQHLEHADVAIVEGVMGLFDGAAKSKGSSAEIAKLLSIPVILVVDASSMAYSAAPLLFGFKHFDPDINFAGVIFNKTGSASHVRILEESARDAGLDMLGYIPRDTSLSLESRHLGLHLPGENKSMEVVDTAARLVDKHINIDGLLRACRFQTQRQQKRQLSIKGQQYVIAVARDQAFNFTYQANLDALSKIGNIVYFSPIEDQSVPDAAIMWLPGGYPELFAEKLSKNTSMLKGIKNFAEAGKTLVAECGGMMYLGKSITDKNGVISPMAGVFDYSTSFQNMKLRLGYREILLKNQILKGHEFHYSHLVDYKSEPSVNEVRTARGDSVEMPIFQYKNCWASYMHLYLGNTSGMLNFLKSLTHHE